MNTKEVTKALSSIADIFAFLTERGVLSSFYLAALAFPLIITATGTKFTPTDHFWIAATCIVLGLVISNVTYELLLGVFRFITERIVLRNFHRVVGREKIFQSYEELRTFRERFLALNANEHLKIRIQNDENLRRATTYIGCSNILAFFVLIVIWLASPSDLSMRVVRVELYVTIYFLIATIIGGSVRSASLGRYIAYAYLHQNPGKNQ